MIKEGQVVNGYTLEKKLGQGAMGSVWLSKHPGLGVPVAIKILKTQLVVNDIDFLHRFIKEGRLAASIDSIHMVRVYDAGTQHDLNYLVLEYVDGTDMDQRLKTYPQGIPFDEVIELAICMAKVLRVAHSKGIIHRDIKPENILRTNKGLLKLADLGIAKQVNDENSNATMAGIAMGTPFYISPEQAMDASSVDARCDIYSLGCTLYHLLTGYVPFAANSPMAVMMKHVQEPLVHPKVKSPHLPDNICSVICKMMEKNPDRRYQDCGELLKDLQLIQEDTAAAVSDLQASAVFSKLDMPFKKNIGRKKKKPTLKKKPSQNKKIAIALSALILCTLSALLAFPPKDKPKIKSTETLEVKANRDSEQIMQEGNVDYDQILEDTTKAANSSKSSNARDNDVQNKMRRELLERLKLLRSKNGRMKMRVESAKFTIGPHGIELDLSHFRKLRDISPLKGLKIWKLDLSSTSVSDISVLKGMPLQSLDLYQCYIKDISPLKNSSIVKLVLPLQCSNPDILFTLKKLKDIAVPNNDDKTFISSLLDDKNILEYKAFQ